MGGSLALVVVGGLTTGDGAGADHAAIHDDGGLAWVGAWEVADLVFVSHHNTLDTRVDRTKTYSQETAAEVGDEVDVERGVGAHVQGLLHASLVSAAGPVGVVGAGGLDQFELHASLAVVLVHGVDLGLELGVL